MSPTSESGFPTPFGHHESHVCGEWIDGNGHMNLAYYLVIFDHGSDAIFDALGFGAAYRAQANHGPFAVESHILYEQELLEGERVRVTTQILGADAKRLHLALEMYRLRDGARAAAQEVMYLHVDLAARRAAPFPADLRTRIAAAATAHEALPRPDWIGRRVAMPAGRATPQAG